MNSRERVLRAMHGGDVDYLPCSIYFNANLVVDGKPVRSLEDRCRLAASLGTDPFVAVGWGETSVPGVATHCHRENVSGVGEILWQTWETPVGALRQGVKLTAENRGWERISWDDVSASNLYEPLVKTPADVKCVEHLFPPLHREAFGRAKTALGETFVLAQRYGAPTILTYGQGLALPMFMMGAQNLVLFAMDYPEAFAELAEIGHRVSMSNIHLAKELGVDILKRFGGYEMTNFFNPEIFETVVMPQLKKEVALAHELGLTVFYRVVTGMEPLLEQIASIGFDCIEGGEPHLSRCSLEDWQAAFSGKAASWTGVSTPVLLGGGSTEAVREEVRHAINVFGRNRFILGVTNSIRNHFPWENTLAMVDEWKQCRE